MIGRRTFLQAGGGLALTAALGSPARGREWDRLRRRLTGELVRPGDPAYGFAKQNQVAAFDSVDPQAIAYCVNDQDVRACIEFAQWNGVPARVRSGGHNMRGWSTSEGMIIDVSRLRHVLPGDGVVHLGPGAQAVDVLAALRPHDLQLAAGTCPTVCPGGFLSGGGIGYQTRKFGMGSDRVKSVGMVLADGRIVRASARQEPDLFWAVRGGGGGNFGVVTDFEVRPIDVPVAVNFELVWHVEHARAVYAAWQDWVLNGPREIGTSIVVLNAPLAGGQPVIVAGGTFLGPLARLEPLLADLVGQSGAQPFVRDVGQELSYSDAMHVRYCRERTLEQCHREGTTPTAELPRSPFMRQSYALFDRALTTTEIDAVMSRWDSHTNLTNRHLQCFAIGGAASEPSRTSTAFAHRDANFLMGYIAGLPTAQPPAEQIAAADAWTDACTGTLSAFSSGSYINMPNSRTARDWGRATYAENYPRLRRVKAWYDPSGFFRFPQSIGSRGW